MVASETLATGQLAAARSTDELRLLNAACSSPESAAYQDTLAELRDAELSSLLLVYARANLGGLVRCALDAAAARGEEDVVNTRWGEQGLTPLCMAARYGAEEALQALLVGKADVNQTCELGWSALHVAADAGQSACVRRLLLLGARKEALCSGHTPLALAAAAGHAETCAALLSAGAFHSPRLGDERTPLHLAAANGHAAAAAALLAAGAESSPVDASARTPLHRAALNGHVAVIVTLVGAGAQLEARTREACTPLHLAASQGRIAAVAALLSRGANADALDADGNTPMLHAILGPTKQTLCMQGLLPCSDLSIRNAAGLNALHACVTVANSDVLELLLPRVADVDARTAGEGRSALHLACERGLGLLARALLKRGAARMARDSAGETPLQCAAAGGHFSCVTLLLGKPGSLSALTPDEINASSALGWTALHFAAYHGQLGVAHALVAAGASLDAKDGDGDTPHDFAEMEHADNVALLDLLSGRMPSPRAEALCDQCGVACEVLYGCAECRGARYCGAVCQAAAWPVHGVECRRRAGGGGE